MPIPSSQSPGHLAAQCEPHGSTATMPGSVNAVLVPRAQAHSWLTAHRANVLAALTYGAPDDAWDIGVPARLHIPLRRVQTQDVVEFWYADTPTTAGTSGAVQYSVSATAMFGLLHVEQRDEPLEATVQRAYSDVLRAIDAQKMPHLLRVWNYFPHMNADEQGMERYQRFCLGRHRAFEQHYHDRMIERLPAASAIGTPDGGLVICFLAAAERGVHLENPRQVSAYQYPRQYGPASPTFARATTKKWSEGTALYLSGTASVVGHESRHADDVREQARETIRNIDALFASTPHPEAARFRMIKAYLRHPADAEFVNALIAERWGADTPLLIVQGDICRRELMLEIEGVCG